MNLFGNDAAQETLHELVNQAPAAARNDAWQVFDFNLKEFVFKKYC